MDRAEQPSGLFELRACTSYFLTLYPLCTPLYHPVHYFLTLHHPVPPMYHPVHFFLTLYPLCTTPVPPCALPSHAVPPLYHLVHYHPLGHARGV